MGTVYIYALLDPLTLDVRYVGKSVSPEKRLVSHIQRSVRGRTRKHRWIRSLTKRGLVPVLKILEETNDLCWETRETYWIKYFRESGADLTNHTDGGDGIHNPDAETRAKISLIRKEKYANDKQFRDMMLAVTSNPERCHKISVALTGKPKSKEHIAKLPQNQPRPKRPKAPGQPRKKRVFRIDEKRCRSKKQSLVPKTDEHKKLISDGVKRSWETRERVGRVATKNIDWPEYTWIEEQLETMTMNEVSELIGVKRGTLSAKVFRERKKREHEKVSV